MTWADPGHPLTALLGLVVGVLLGWWVPAVVGRLPEPAPDPEPEGEGDGAGIVRFVALPAGTGPTSVDEGALLHVEGRVIGDERNFDRLAVHFADGGDDELAAMPGVIAVRTRVFIERLRDAIDNWA